MGSSSPTQRHPNTAWPTVPSEDTNKNENSQGCHWRKRLQSGQLIKPRGGGAFSKATGAVVGNLEERKQGQLSPRKAQTLFRGSPTASTRQEAQEWRKFLINKQRL